MRNTNRSFAVAAIGLLGWVSHVFGGIVGLTISVQNTNLALSWPSSGSENYLVQYRSTLDTNSTWTTLTNNLPAAIGTNRTAFLILGVVPPPSPPSTNIGGGGGLLPPGFNSAIMAEPYESDGTETPLEDDTVLFLATRRIFPPYVWDREHRLPLPWELEVRPPYPWEATALNAARAEKPTRMETPLQGGITTESSESTTEAQVGFFRVFHVPDFAFNVTNYTYGGPTFFPVDFTDYLDRVEDVVVLLNGQPVPQAVLMPYVSQGVTNWGMGIFFDLVPSGTYHIQLRSTLRLNDEIGDATAYLVISNRLSTIVVDNEVTFTNWNDFILGNSYTFNAQTKNQDTDWHIDIYDAWGQYINGGSGHTSNGQISWTWNLRDVWGDLRDDLDYDPYYDTYITFDTFGSGFSAANAQTTRRTPAPLPYPDVGAWIISYADRNYLDAGTNYSEGNTYYQDGIDNLVGGPALWDIPTTKFPLKFGTNVYTQAQRDASWVDMKALMFSGRYRNFYYYGHGAATSIGGDTHTFNSSNFVTGGISLPGSKANLNSSTVRNEITFNRYSGARPFRFVFLDGCNTANGDWPDAFGIGKGTNTLSWYTSTNNTRHVRPSAFVGWTVVVGGPGWGTAEKFWQCRGFWMGNWSVDFIDYELIEALEDACIYSEWIDIDKFRQSIRVFGYRTLRFNEYNTKGAWPP